jgi:hypothetical protein
MTKPTQTSTAQVVDTFMQRTALGILLMSVKFSLAAAAPFLPATLDNALDIAAVLLSIAAALVILPAFARYIERRKSDKGGCRHVESYVVEMFREAGMRAFSATFVLLISLQIFADTVSPDLPVGFYLDLIMAVSLGVAALSFLALVRDDADEEDCAAEDGEAEDGEAEDAFGPKDE